MADTALSDPVTIAVTIDRVEDLTDDEMLAVVDEWLLLPAKTKLTETPWIALDENDGVEVLAALRLAADVLAVTGDSVMSKSYRDLHDKLDPASSPADEQAGVTLEDLAAGFVPDDDEDDGPSSEWEARWK
jgi:hypothetical protein